MPNLVYSSSKCRTITVLKFERRNLRPQFLGENLCYMNLVKTVILRHLNVMWRYNEKRKQNKKTTDEELLNHLQYNYFI